MKRQDYDKVLVLLKKLQTQFFNEVDNYRILGYEIYLKVKYDLINLSSDEINFYENNITQILKDHPEYADLWNVLGLIYIVHTKNLFNISLNNFSKALDINTSFKIAKKNKKLVENDGKELISVLNTMLK